MNVYQRFLKIHELKKQNKTGRGYDWFKGEIKESQVYMESRTV